MDKNKVIKEVFEDFGYIDLDVVYPDADFIVKSFEYYFVTTELLRMTKKPTQNWGEYRLTGPKSMLLKMLKKHWDEGKSFLDHYYKKIR